jgi:hypothetical protein
MMLGYYKTVINFGSAREALLYFDNIIPVNLLLDLVETDRLELPPGVFDQFLTPEFGRKPEFVDRLNAVNQAMVNYMVEYAERIVRDDVQAGLQRKLNSNSDLASGKNLIDVFCGFRDDFNLRAVPINFFGNLLVDEDVDKAEVAISLTTLRLIDASRCSWDQILEFRQDGEARDKLRRLRLFAYENYSGKPNDYIEDDILKRIADYDEAAKQWGFETAQSALNMLLNSKIMGGALTGSLVSTLFGTPTLAVASAAAGGTLEIGRIALEVTKQRFALRKLAAENPVSYILHARSKLGNPNNA